MNPPEMSSSDAGESVPGLDGAGRNDFAHFLTIPTRWADNDVYGHVNNVEYYAFFDTVINRWLIAEGGLDIHGGDGDRALRRVALQLPRGVQLPRDVEAGLRVGQLGSSSVRYELGLFAAGAAEPAATGWFVHVFVDAETRRPVPIPDELRAALERLQPGSGREGPRRRPARDGRASPLRRVAAARDRGARARPARAGRAARPGRRRRALPLRPLGDRRLAPAGDADGARPRGGRRGRRGRRRGRRLRASATTWSSPSCPPAASASRAAPAARRCASRARRRTPPGRCSAASGGSASPTAASLNHHLGVSAFADHIVVSERSAVRVDPTLPFEIAALFGCAVLTGVGAAVNAARIDRGRPGRGLRPRRRRARGAARARCSPAAGTIVAVDVIPEKLELARELGATDAVAAGPDAVEAVREATDGGADHAIETVGSAAVLADAYAATRRGGTTTTVGLPDPSQMLEIPAVGLVAEERTLRGSYLGSCVPGARHAALHRALQREGRLPVERLLTHRLALDEINEGFDRLASGEAVRQAVVFDWTCVV